MVNAKVAAQPFDGSYVHGSAFERFPAHQTSLGALKVLRVLPIRQKRLVGAWCFLDRFGPLSFSEAKAMDVAPHPHIGLQTVSWLLQGEVVHKDSLGNEALLRPRGVNVMTSGGGIAHAEETPPKNSGILNGVQLWIALPDADRHGPASFQHIAEVLLTGDADIDGRSIDATGLWYLGTTRSVVEFKSRNGCRVLLIGGPPFPEKILMWWNFVARTPEEIAQARSDWQSHQRFGEVKAYRGARLAAPPLQRFAPPNPAS